MRINVPNQITLGRLAVTIIFFAVMSRYSAAQPGTQWLLPWCFWIYLIAALSDAVDGYLARTWGQITSFGRVVDPVADKIMVCGAFVFFASSHFYNPETKTNISGVEPWMAVLILLREFLISAIRSFSESQGREFSANWVGKLKSFVQLTTVCVVLGVLAFDLRSLHGLQVACIWTTVAVTALSIVAYLHRAYAFVLSDVALGGDPAAPAKPAPPPKTPRVATGAPEGASA